MPYGWIYIIALMLVALLVFLVLLLLKHVTRACLPHPLTSEWDALAGSCPSQQTCGAPSAGAQPGPAEARDGLLTGAGLFLCTVLGLAHHPVWLAGALVCGAYLVLSAFTKADTSEG